jgi:DNA ligase-1
MTDEMLAWQTGRFTELMTHDDGWVVHLRPEQVVEIATTACSGPRATPAGWR